MTTTEPDRTAHAVTAETALDADTRTTRRRRGKPSSRGWRITPYLFVLVPVALLVTFTFVPVANMVFYSFTSWDGLDKNFDTRFRNFFKGMIFFPYLVNGVAIGLIFLFFFRPGGTLDSVLALFGVDQPVTQWLGNPDVANFSLAGVSIWRYMGLNFVLFLGAIQSIPSQLYEAAELDGANRWQQFRYIIAPGIRPIIGLSTILAVSGSLSVFEIPFIMTGGANGTATFVIQTVSMAFKIHKFGLASAMAVILLLIVLLVTWIQRRVFPDEKVDLT
jgi:ABC-type sugar transport system permease subunit